MNNINSQFEWMKLRKPEDVPSSPSSTYKKEWKSWMDFFGRETHNVKIVKIIYQRK